MDKPMMPAKDLIMSLAARLDEVLQSLIPAGANCALLEFPNYANAGDSAIWIAERKWLQKNRNTIVYTCDKDNYSRDILKSRIGEGIILLQGGGNFGDLWGDFQHFHERIIQDFPTNKIIQLPQTIFFKGNANLDRCRQILNAHPNLTLLCRDKQSFEFAQKEFTAQRILCPDMVFALELIKRSGIPETEIVWLSRTDKETVNRPRPLDEPGLERTDWLDEPATVFQTQYKDISAEIKFHPEKWVSLYDRFLTTCDQLAEERFLRGCRLLSKGKMVITDRLHGHVLCLLMGIPHIVLDNNYGKVRGLYETWTQNNHLSAWADSSEEAINTILSDKEFRSTLNHSGADLSALDNLVRRLKTLLHSSAWTTVEADAKKLWEKKLFQTRNDILPHIAGGQALILVDDDLIKEELNLKENKIIPFLERNGSFWGFPADSETAISEFENMRQRQHVDFIAFTWPSFWWLDYYPAFNDYLRTKFKCSLENDRLVLLSLQA